MPPRFMAGAEVSQKIPQTPSPATRLRAERPPPSYDPGRMVADHRAIPDAHSHTLRVPLYQAGLPAARAGMIMCHQLA